MPGSIQHASAMVIELVVDSRLESDVTIELSGRLEVEGETFRIEFEDDSIYLVHPDWSLVGVGATLGEAELNLRRDAELLATVMADFETTTLDEKATALQRYVLGFLGSSGT